MPPVQVIDQGLLDAVSQQAGASPRRRRNHNFHARETDACHRLLNAMEPDSYIPPHCHADPAKDETIVALRGRLGLIVFDEHGNVTEKAVLEPGGQAVGVNIPHGVFHTVVALKPGSVFLESKAGPYQPLSPGEKAGWAPAEGAPEAALYLAGLKRLLQDH